MTSFADNGTPGAVHRTVLLAIAALLCAGAVAAVAAAPANAIEGRFCPPLIPPITIELGPYPERCVHAYHSGYTFVEFANETTNVKKCAVVKPNSDGSGGDVGAPAVCAIETQTAFWSVEYPGVGGYATGINRSSHFHTGFYGYINYF